MWERLLSDVQQLNTRYSGFYLEFVPKRMWDLTLAWEIEKAGADAAVLSAREMGIRQIGSVMANGERLLIRLPPYDSAWFRKWSNEAGAALSLRHRDSLLDFNADTAAALWTAFLLTQPEGQRLEKHPSGGHYGSRDGWKFYETWTLNCVLLASASAIERAGLCGPAVESADAAERFQSPGRQPYEIVRDEVRVSNFNELAELLKKNETPDPVGIKSLGNMTYSDGTQQQVTLTDRQDKVLQAFLYTLTHHGRNSMSLEELKKNAGFDDPHKVLKSLAQSHPFLGKFITLPEGQKGVGYRVNMLKN